MSESRGLRILCLDGGDARCMSQLYILQEVMERLEHKLGKPIRPCDYFDLIVAVDTSSLIAAFLGLFHMTIPEAQDAFNRIYPQVFADPNCSPKESAALLEALIKNLLKGRGISETALLSDKLFTGTCKVALLYSSAANLDYCKMFRNYKSSRVIRQDVTVVEALRASCATPGLLPTISIGTKGYKEEVLSALRGFSNPTPEAIRETYHVFGPETHVSCLLSLGSGHRGVVSIDHHRSPHSLAAQITMNGEKIAEDLQRRLDGLDVYYRFSVDHGLEGWWQYLGGFGTAKTHVDAFLSKEEQSKKLDRCLGAAENLMGTKIEQLYGIRRKGSVSAHGLPPLSTFFVMRRRPMEAIVSGLLERPDTMQRIVVVSGLGGSGKTQLVLRYARDFEHSYRHIFFVDASSDASLRGGLISRVRGVIREDGPTTIEEVMSILADPDGACSKDWLIIMDNADDHSVPFADYIPMSDHGSVLITTRDPELGNLSPDYHLTLDVMDPDEAVDALISTIFPRHGRSSETSTPISEAAIPLVTPEELEIAAAIVKDLHYLPIAIIQAGCYIKQNQCLDSYRDRLKSNRLQLLRRATPVHLDKLKYSHSVYACLETTVNALSSRAIQLLGILSFFHCFNFPKPLFGVGARSRFTFQEFNFFDRSSDSAFNGSVQLLLDILCPTGTWSEEDLEELLDELQRYSLLTIVSSESDNIKTLRFHPLVNNWARDRLLEEDLIAYRRAAIRLLLSGVSEADEDGIHDYLASQTTPILSAFTSPPADKVHANDMASITLVLENGDSARNLDIWVSVHHDVEAVFGVGNPRTLPATVQLADAYGRVGDDVKMEKMEREALVLSAVTWGRDHLETSKVRANLARTLRDSVGDYPGAFDLEKNVLRCQLRDLGLKNPDTAQAMEELATTLSCLSLYQDAIALSLGALAIRIKLHGGYSRSIFGTLNQLAGINYLANQLEEAKKWRMQEMELRKQLQGPRNSSTLATIAQLASLCYELGHHEEAEKWWREGAAGYRVLEGESSQKAALMTFRAGLACFQLKRYDEAEAIWKELLQLTKSQDDEVLLARTLARLTILYQNTGRLRETKETAEETIRICKGKLEPEVPLLPEVVKILEDVNSSLKKPQPPRITRLLTFLGLRRQRILQV